MYKRVPYKQKKKSIYKKDEVYATMFFNKFHTLIENTITYLILWKMCSQISHPNQVEKREIDP